MHWHRFDAAIAIVLSVTALLWGQWIYQQPRATTLTLDLPPALLPREGLYDWETFADRPGGYRWTSGAAQVSLPNFGGPTLLDVTLVGGPRGATPVRLQAGADLGTFVVRPELRTYTLLLPPAPGERQTLTIEAPTVKRHKRSLGIAVSEMRVAGGAAAPTLAAFALVVASLGGYALLRQAGLRVLPAGLAVAGLQLGASVWQDSGGWQYGLFSRVLLLVGAAGLVAVALEWWRPGVDIAMPPAMRWSQVDLYPLAIVLGASLCIRLPLLAAPDPVGDLELAARRMQFLLTDGLAGAYRSAGDYMPLRLYILAGLGRLVQLLGGMLSAPLSPVTLVLIKIPSLLADLATTVIIYTWARRWCAPRRSAVIAALYALAPPVWINVAWWGQVDALLMLPLVGTMLLLDRAGGRWSWVCWAGALLIKAQAIILAPLLYIATLRRHGCRGLVQGGTIAAVLLIATSLPLILAGQGPGLVESYVGAVERFPRTSYGAYNLWYLLLAGRSFPDTWPAIGPFTFRVIGLALLGAATLLICTALFRRSDAVLRVSAAAVLALAFFLLPTQIHERYLFLSLAFLALYIPSAAWLALPYLVLVATATLNILGILKGFAPPVHASLQESPATYVIAVINLAVLGLLMGHLLVRSGEEAGEQPNQTGPAHLSVS